MHAERRKKHNYECLNELFESLYESYRRVTRFLHVLDFGPGVKDPAADSPQGREMAEILNRFAEIYAGNRDKLLERLKLLIDRVD